MAKITKSIVKKVNIVEDIICDRCGNSCKIEFYDNECSFNFATILPSFGYGSSLDMLGNKLEEKYICEDCYKEIFKIRK